MKFSKVEFVEVIEALREQYDHDLKKSKIFSDTFGVEALDNSRITNQVFKMLQSQFPPQGDHCLIHWFCYVMNFGRWHKKDVLTSADLWDLLIINLEVKDEEILTGDFIDEHLEPRRDELIDSYPEMEFMTADGFDGAILGMDQGTMRVIYSVEKCMEILEDEGMDQEDAMEHFSYNVEGSYVGELTPIWCYDI